MMLRGRGLSISLLEGDNMKEIWNEYVECWKDYFLMFLFFHIGLASILASAYAKLVIVTSAGHL